jgi:uncharacterized protein
VKPVIADKRTFYQLSVVTLYGFGLLGWAIIEFGFDYPFIAIFIGEIPWFTQILTGLAYGIITGLLAVFLVMQKFFSPSRRYFVALARKLDLNYSDIIFISLCAGVGEEIFFRAALQPMIGIWPAAIIFVALHGYLNPKNLKISVYGIYMVIVSAGFGYLYEYAGIWSAISAHFIIDVILFSHLKAQAKRNL